MSSKSLSAVITTLDTVIANKSKYKLALESEVQTMEISVTVNFLKVNLVELNNIRDHLLLVTSI
jgi:NADH:ubiquinone oxidoreductase subunit D